MTEKNLGGRPKRFESKEELMNLFLDFVEDIKASGYNSIPSQTAFCSWLRETGRVEADRKTIYNTVTKYFPDIKKQLNELQAETMVEGGMQGKYVPSMTIFALKNWYGYRDRQDIEHSGAVSIVLEGAAKDWSE